jgi:cell division transport system ATP-binding protein
VGGQNLAALGETALAILRRRIGFVFQDHKLLFDRNAFENAALPLRIAGFPASETSSRVARGPRQGGIARPRKGDAIALSGGEQQRLCIARAIVGRPAILIADEPTGNLDAESAHAILDLFRAFHQVGVTVLLSTHDEAGLDRLACRRIALTHGALAEAA